jgi:hypothetical protein
LSADKFTRAVWWVNATDDILRSFVTGSGWATDGAHRELANDAGDGVKQIRLHSSLS